MKLQEKSNEEEIKKNHQDIRKQQNNIQDLQGNIRVFCRVRPTLEDEEDIDPISQKKIISYSQQQKGLVDVIGRENAITLMSKSHESFTFTFDKIFKEDANQEDIFEESSEMIKSVMEGHKVCIFAYGETGSGKTHTILGDEKDNGIVPRALEMIFDQSQEMKELGWHYKMHVALMEISENYYYDKFGYSIAQNKDIVVRHDNEGNIEIPDVTWFEISGKDSIKEVSEIGISKRSKTPEIHMVTMLKIEGKNVKTSKKVKGILSLVDLGGSEGAGSGIQEIKEAKNLDRNLIVLGKF